MKTLSKYTQLNFIGDIWEPHYNGYEPDFNKAEVYIAKWKIDRSKLDIKLRFSKVSDTSDFTGDWFISRKKAKLFRKKFNNNGMECYVIPWTAFEPLIIDNSGREDIW